jgi:uncharacterized protein (DUF885 family)
MKACLKKAVNERPQVITWIGEVKKISIPAMIVLTLITSCGKVQPTSTVAPAKTPLPMLGPVVPETTESTKEQFSPEINLSITKLEGLSFEEFLEVSFRELTMRTPETVLEVGLTDIYNMKEVKLDDISNNFRQETYELTAYILELLKKFDRTGLTPEQQISYDIYQWYLEDILSGKPFMYYDYLATYYFVTSIHEQLILFFTDIHPVTSLQEAKNYVTRLNQVGIKIEQLIEGLELRAQAGITPPEFAVEWAFYTTLNDLVNSNADATPFYTALKAKVDKMQNVSSEAKQEVLADAENAIRRVVLPAYQELYSYMQEMDVYSKEDSGVWRLPDGENYYINRLHHFTTTGLTAAQIHDLGLEQLDRIHAGMRMIFDELGYPQDEGLAQLYDRVAQGGGRISGQDVLTTYERLISEADQNLDTVFDIRPRADVIVVADQYGGFYIAGSIDGSRPGAFYAGVGGSGEDYYAMPTLAYHEAIPGHHFQIALAQEMHDLPSSRQMLSFTAYTEGWALYAEQLAEELGWYAGDPYGKLGMLQAQAFRATRLVVDTGLHAKGWTFTQAQEFFTENTGFEVGDNVNPQHEIARYLVWPGQSTSYYIGFLKILELRQVAMDQLGDQFDLKEFHRVILSNGSMPLEILERVVGEYIVEKLSSQ